MKVTAILGSPRKKGTTTAIATAFMEQAAFHGADTTFHVLNSMNFQGCQGCQACKEKREDCVLEDDLTVVLNDMKTSDITVFATPVYYWDVSGQFKLFIDRTWSLVKPDYLTNPDPARLAKGKKALLITSQADIEEKHKDVMQKYSGFLTMYGYDVATIRAFGMGGEASNPVEPYIAKAKQIADRMMA